MSTSTKRVLDAAARPSYGSIADVAAIHNVHPRTVRRWIAAGLLPAYRVGPREIRIDLNDAYRLASRVPTAGGRHDA